MRPWPRPAHHRSGIFLSAFTFAAAPGILSLIPGGTCGLRCRPVGDAVARRGAGRARSGGALDLPPDLLPGSVADRGLSGSGIVLARPRGAGAFPPRPSLAGRPPRSVCCAWPGPQTIASLGVRLLGLLIFATRSPPELSVDLMRQVPDASYGTMDFLFARIIERARDEGYSWFDFGVAPLERPASAIPAMRVPPSASPAWPTTTATIFTTTRGCAFSRTNFTLVAKPLHRVPTVSALTHPPDRSRSPDRRRLSPNSIQAVRSDDLISTVDAARFEQAQVVGPKCVPGRSGGFRQTGRDRHGRLPRSSTVSIWGRCSPCAVPETPWCPPWW